MPARISVPRLERDLEVEPVSPLGGRRVQQGDDAVARPHERVRVVLDVVLPVPVRDEAVDVDELAREQTHQVDHVDALVEKNAASARASAWSASPCPKLTIFDLP